MRILWLGFLLLTLLGGLNQARASDSALQAELERVYYQWRGAVLNRDVRAWQASTSRYRQVHTHNLIVSQKMRYPDAVFDVPLKPPDIVSLKLLEAQAVGETAHLVYFGRVDLGLEAEIVPENLLMLRFVRDPEGWRFDTSRVVNLENAPDIRSALKEGADPDFLDRPEFNPPGTAPTVPKVCSTPEYMAAFQIRAIGYEARMHVNGFDYPPVQDLSVNQLIIGGLRKNENDVRLSLKATEVPEGEERQFALNVMVINHPRAGQEPIVVSQYTTSDPNPPESRRISVWVNQSTLNR